MTTLGAVLEAIHSGPRTFRTARVAGRSRGSLWRLWWAGSRRYRFEREREGALCASAQAGETWWTLDADGVLHTNEGVSTVGLGMPSEAAMLHPRSLLAAAVLELVGEDEVAGRPAAVLQATPRAGAEPGRWWWFPEEIGRVELAVDLEHGVVLRGVGYQAEEIAFDEPFPDEVFVAPKDGVRAVAMVPELPEEVSLEEAARRATFALAVPRSLPDGARLVRCLVEAAQPPGWVGLAWAIDPGYRYSLHLRQGPAVEVDAGRFAAAETAEVVEEGIRLVERGDGRGSVHRMFVEGAGAWFEIGSDLPLEMVIAFARALKHE